MKLFLNNYNMKKLLCSIILLVYFLNFGFAQVTITKNDCYNLNDVVPQMYHTLTNVNANTIISDPLIFRDNYTNNYTLDTLRYVDCSVLAPNNMFVASSFAMKDINLRNSFYTINESKITLDGISGLVPFIDPNGTIAVKFNTPLTVINFPSSMGSTINESSTGYNFQHISTFEQMLSQAPQIYQALSNKYDSVKFEVVLNLNSNYDQNGTMSFEGSEIINGDFNYLREKRILKTVSDVYLRQISNETYYQINECTITTMFGELNLGSLITQQYNMRVPVKDSSYSYNYWANLQKGPLAEVILNSDFTTIEAIHLRSQKQTCEVPTNLSVTQLANLSLQAKWNKVNYAESYNVYINDTYTANVTDTSYIIPASSDTLVCVKVATKCSSENISEPCIPICYDLTNINQINLLNINLYPNPADKSITLQLDKYQESKLILFNTIGKKIDEINISNCETIINIENYNKGTYLYKLVDKFGNTLKQSYFIKY